MKLGVNIDHFITVRRLRDTVYPKTLDMLEGCLAGGADQITLHIREDRRHASEADLEIALQWGKLPVNLEMAIDNGMLELVKKPKFRPTWVCLVPERRNEQTTEGGLKLTGREHEYYRFVQDLVNLGTKVALFIEPDEKTVEQSAKFGATAVELHTGKYCHIRKTPQAATEMNRLIRAASLAYSAGLEVHAGHGMDYEFMKEFKQIPHLIEVNIGHSIVAKSLFVGIKEAVRLMKGSL